MIAWCIYHSTGELVLVRRMHPKIVFPLRIICTSGPPASCFIHKRSFSVCVQVPSIFFFFVFIMQSLCAVAVYLAQLYHFDITVHTDAVCTVNASCFLTHTAYEWKSLVRAPPHCWAFAWRRFWHSQCHCAKSNIIHSHPKPNDNHGNWQYTVLVLNSK